MGLKELAAVVILGAVIAATGYVAATSQGYMSVGDLARASPGERVAVDGTIIDYYYEGGNVVLVLTDDSGARAAIVIDVKEFTALHGRPPGDWMLGLDIGVRGILEGPREGLVGVVLVEEILNPCHESYSAPPANV